VSAAAAVRLDTVRARKLTRELQRALDVAVGLLTEVYDGRVWLALDYPTWDAYCAAELPQLALLGKGLPGEERVAKVAELRRLGMSLRAIATALGLAPNTVKAAADAAGVQLAEVVSLDGATRRMPAAPRPRRRGPAKTDRTVALLAAAGPEGLSVLEVARELRCPQHKAAATLTRLEDAGRIVYVRPERRGQFGRYVRVRIGQ
jgi:DNA-binding MarR family transcriptional regulator